MVWRVFIAKKKKKSSSHLLVTFDCFEGSAVFSNLCMGFLGSCMSVIYASLIDKFPVCLFLINILPLPCISILCKVEGLSQAGKTWTFVQSKIKVLGQLLIAVWLKCN